ncbi:serine/threonine-protein kinase [Segetibacter koreensis]|uniref:serine/threonine-protein kinase n=1 Tax=Segetibacter koreensis TaxID=398037 RepID=UPI00037F625A|nr:serine/threonine-protein kinase [Segetibacter koreensis]
MAKVFTITEGLENLGALKTGGQGSVYKGRRIGEIITAIKLLPTPIHSESTEDKNFTAFQNEVQKLKKVNEQANPNVVKILSYGITDSGNFPFIEMEYIEGPDLEELLQPPHDPVFTIKEVLKVADQLSSALAHCHKIDVRHGDIKSNNVKYNVSTGNYVLLDFGLSVMSDEQRRTSLRHAGAIEFMAPEQNEGQMLFQTDVYSFGIILFELLAGQVPFPLNDKGETARNKVMLAHLESLPPDLLSLRQKSLPDNWSDQKKKDEMKVPDWVTNMIYKCLEKKPEDRYTNGIELHQYIWEHSIQRSGNSAISKESVSSLEQENKRLRREKQQLQQQLLQYQQFGATSNPNNSTDFYKKPDNRFDTEKADKVKSSKSPVKRSLILTIVVIIALSAAAFILIESKKVSFLSLLQTTPIGKYKVVASHTYAYDDPDESTRTDFYAIPGNDTVIAFDKKNGFIYAEITNRKGQKLKGWFRNQDVMTLDEWNKRKKSDAESQNAGITGQLQNAKQLLSSGKTVEALIIYNNLSKQQVPEAMYEYGVLALQNVNLNITCTEAFDLVKRAEEKGYVPAKRTLGFLYSFADDKRSLQQNKFYERCTFGKNLEKGSKLLMEATLAGDTAASRLLDKVNELSQLR